MQHDAPLPTPRNPRYHALDLWRGVACLMIVVFHSISYTPYYRSLESVDTYVPKEGLGGKLGHLIQVSLSELWLGVPIFFVISGYCITAAIDLHRRRSTSVGSYFVRRLRRIYPPYWTAVLFTVAVVSIVWITGHSRLFADELAPFWPWEISVGQWFGNLALIETWRHHVTGGNSGQFMGIMWTLCYEEQFYAIAGLILLIARKRIFWAATLITFGSCVLRWFAYKANTTVDGFFFDGHWMQFAIGIFVYWYTNYCEHRTRNFLAFSGVILIGLLLRHHLPSDVDRSTVAAGLFGCLLMALHRWDEYLAQAKWLGSLRWCGTICYSMYLTHWPICKIVSHAMYLNGWSGIEATLLLTIPLCLTLSIGLASLFYFVVERQFLNHPVAKPSTTLAPIKWFGKAEATR